MAISFGFNLTVPLFFDEETGMRKAKWDFPGGPVVKNLPDNAGDTGLILGWGRSRMLWSN